MRFTVPYTGQEELLAGHKLQGKDAKENERAVQYNLTKCIRLFAISVANFAVAAQMKALLYTGSYKRCSMHTLVPLKSCINYALLDVCCLLGKDHDEIMQVCMQRPELLVK